MCCFFIFVSGYCFFGGVVAPFPMLKMSLSMWTVKPLNPSLLMRRLGFGGVGGVVLFIILSSEMVLSSFYFTSSTLESCGRVRTVRQVLWGVIPCPAFGCSTWQFGIASGCCGVWPLPCTGSISNLSLAFMESHWSGTKDCLWKGLLTWETSIYFPFVCFVVFCRQ